MIYLNLLNKFKLNIKNILRIKNKFKKIYYKIEKINNHRKKIKESEMSSAFKSKKLHIIAE